MKLTIDRSRLLKLLNTVNVAIGSKSPTPAFLNFKLEMVEDGLIVLGSDNELTIKSFLPIMDGEKQIISNYEQGATLISAKLLLDIVRKLANQTVTIEIIDDVIVQISDEQVNFKLNSMRAEEYPDLDLFVSGEEVTFDSEDFKKIISQTAFAASTKEVRPILTAVNVKAVNNQIEFVATDSYRLAKKIYESDKKYNFEANIPVKALVEVSKLLEEDSLSLYISQNKVIFKFGETYVFSRLISGDFPKTSRMIPDNYPFVLRVDASKFVNAMERVSLLVVEKERVCKLNLDINSVEVSSRSEQIGSARETIDMYEYEGNRFSISYNVDYVSEAIKACKSSDVILSFAGEMNAFKVTSTEDETIVQIVTPVRSYY